MIEAAAEGPFAISALLALATLFLAVKVFGWW
jgi:hypothetical protein